MSNGIMSSVAAFTLLAKGNHVALIGDTQGNVTLATVLAVSEARDGVFGKTVPTIYTEIIVPRIARVENESIVIKDTLTTRRMRYAALGEFVECECVFDEIEKNWYVRENSCVSEKLL